MREVFQHRGEIELETDADGALVALKVYGVQRKVPLPATPINIEVTEITDAKVSLRWFDAGDAKSWNIYRYVTASGPGSSSLVGTSLLSSFTDMTVSADVQYTFEIEAVNQAGASLAREEITLTPTASALPAAPQDFVLLAATATRIHFEWANEIGVVDWQVYRDDVLAATVTIPEFDNTGLTPSTAYTFHVIARNSAGDSAASADFVQSTAANSPPAWSPIGLQTGTVGDGYSLDLSQFCSDPDGQTVTFSILSNTVSGIALAPDGKTLTGTFDTSGIGSIGVRGSDGIATADVTIDFDIAVAADTTAPTVPQNVTAVASGSTVTTNWDESTDTESGVKHYRIEQDGATVGFTGAPPKQFQGVADGTYTYGVRAVDNAGNVSAAGLAAPLTVAVTPPAPDSPINFTASPLDSTTIELTWEPGPSGATPDDYDMDFSTAGSGGPWTALAVGLQTSFTHTGRTPGQRVDYRLKAKAGAEESAYVQTFTTTPASAERVLYAEADFNDGFAQPVPTDRSQATRRKGNGLNFGAVARSQGSGFDALKTTNGGSNFDENGLYDVRMMPSVTIVGNGLTDNVVPRSGARMLHSICYRGKNPVDGNTMGGTTKHYERINGQAGTSTHDGAKCKPRVFLGMTSADGYGIPYDTKTYFGVSIYVPRSHENSTRTVGQTANGPMYAESNLQGPTTDADTTAWSLHLIRPNATQGWRKPNGQLVTSAESEDTWWCLIWELNTTSHLQGSQGGTGQTTKIALAPLLPHTDADSDRGKWTDFVFELCFNPFSTATTVEGWNFRANTGRLRVWKSTGPVSGTQHYEGGNGDRFISESQPLYDTGERFGLRPRDSVSMHTPQLKHYCFFLRGDVPAGGRTHPIETCIDEVRVAYAEDRVHAPAKDSNLVTQWQGGVAGRFSDVLPRAAG